VLAEYSITSGNFTTIATRLLSKIPQNDHKMSYVADRHVFHYIVDDGITYLCMADEEFGRTLPFSFLDDIKSRFRATYAERGKTALAYSMNADFSRVLQNQMDYYSNNPNADKITKVRSEIDKVKTVMVQNIEKVLERGERIELLVDKTENLNQTAVQFKKKSTQVKRRMWWKNVRVLVILIIVILVIVFIATMVGCGGPTFSKCKAEVHKLTTSSATSASATTGSLPVSSATTGSVGSTSGSIGSTSGSVVSTSGSVGSSGTSDSGATILTITAR